MVEVDRVLRPGGYWVLSGPPVQWKRFHKGWKRDPRELEREMNEIEAVSALPHFRQSGTLTQPQGQAIA